MTEIPICDGSHTHTHLYILVLLLFFTRVEKKTDDGSRKTEREAGKKRETTNKSEKLFHFRWTEL